LALPLDPRSEHASIDYAGRVFLVRACRELDCQEEVMRWFFLALSLLCGEAEAQSSVQLVPPGQTLTHTVCGSAVSSCVLKSTPGNLYGVYADCSAACWLMLFNSTAAPSNGSTTAGIAANNMFDCIDIQAGSSKSLSYAVYPIALSTGITVAISSTACDTLTLSAVGFIHGSVK
jgi:hypothetical protein